MGFSSGTTELVADISNQQLIFYHGAQAGFGGMVYVINATLNNIPLSTNNWHHLSVILWSNESVIVTVNGEYTQQGTFGRLTIHDPGSEVPMQVFFSIPSSFNFSLARSAVSLSTQSQYFDGIMRGVAIANVPALDLLSLDQCLLNCIGGESFCSNGASCQDLFGPSRRCTCAQGFTGLQCQYVHDRYSFDGTGYAELTDGPLMIAPLTFDFKTESMGGELWSHTGIMGEGSFSLNEEAVDLDFEFCDSTNTSFTLQPPPSQMLSDNQWHRVSATGAVLQLDNNPPEAAAIQPPSDLACNTSNPGQIVLGSFSNVADTSNNFIGCLRDLIYDGDLLDATSVELVGGAQFGCDRDTAQFFAASYLELPNFNSREAQTISFDISTLSSEAILYFSRRVPADATGPNPSDFVAIYLEGGQIAFIFNLGEGDTTVRSDQAVNDGDWHRIEAMQNSTLSWLSVDGVRVQLPVMSQLELLDTTGSVFLGGVPDNEQFSGFAQYANFDGCLRDLEQNGLAADLRNSTASQNIGYGTCN
jgi:hypothetical protein